MQRGFTLLEIMISLAIVGGLLLTMISSLNYHLGVAERQIVVTNLTNLAKGKIYEMEKNPYVSRGRFPGPYSSFRYETNVMNSSFPGMLEIGVTVMDEKEILKLSEIIRKSP
jgi:general secretion pathway protein I